MGLKITGLEPLNPFPMDFFSLSTTNEAATAAGYKVGAKGVQKRSLAIVKDVERIGKQTGVSVDEDIACFRKVLCSMNFKENPFPLLMSKTLDIILNLKSGKKIEHNEYVKLYDEVKLLTDLGDDFTKAPDFTIKSGDLAKMRLLLCLAIAASVAAEFEIADCELCTKDDVYDKLLAITRDGGYDFSRADVQKRVDFLDDEALRLGKRHRVDVRRAVHSVHRAICSVDGNDLRGDSLLRVIKKIKLVRDLLRKHGANQHELTVLYEDIFLLRTIHKSSSFMEEQEILKESKLDPSVVRRVLVYTFEVGKKVNYNAVEEIRSFYRTITSKTSSKDSIREGHKLLIETLKKHGVKEEDLGYLNDAFANFAGGQVSWSHEHSETYSVVKHKSVRRH
ncbi:unnamed protein product [Bursaphelenchus xylophilus]|uniref:(pine wood nematode) hypothetical protein n=1 Tax=Bursaphelenchus xylophilus TaxID=6326 RepID=A0A1I7RZ51_BURXY|nr:unnamed protein product [Bursaphelenchus xylophilus]CAG9106849.1 unnamed protein product [Bursaphelenchus xylophilus]